MSRIWKLPIVIPSGVQVTITGQYVEVKGPKWFLSMEALPACRAVVEANQVVVSLVDQEQKQMRGLTRTLIANMVEGVSNGFEKKLHIIGIWYSAKVQGKQLVLNLWFSHQVTHQLPESVQASVEKDPKWNDILTLTSIDKQLVGQEAATIRAYRKPEPYKGKWVRYLGEQIKLKAGKTATKK